MFKVIVNKNGKTLNLTELVGGLVWGNSLQNMTVQLEFSITTDESYIRLPEVVEVGDIVLLYKNELIFKGIIVQKNEEELNKQSFVVFDFLFYLKQNKLIKQINGTSASSAIRDICKELNLNVKVPFLATKIEKIYYQDSVKEIIEDILAKVKSETGEEYILEIFEETLEIYKKGDKMLNNLTFKPAPNVAEFNIFKAIGKDYKVTSSIEELKNSIVYFNPSLQKQVGTVKDKESINKYGLLQEVFETEESDRNKIENYAKNSLEILNKEAKMIVLKVLGSEKLRSGRCVNIKNDKLRLNGKYLITECSHSVNKGIYLCEVSLERI